jgi:hypothetical protein
LPHPRIKHQRRLRLTSTNSHPQSLLAHIENDDLTAAVRTGIRKDRDG